MRRSLFTSSLVVASLASVLCAGDAGAVVLQIDGTICPQTGNIVPGLAKGENGAPYTNTAAPATPIDPVFDAAEAPQVFAVPKTGGVYAKVDFIDLLEGAGYENTFGWYNVGDDLSNLANLYPVLTCQGTNYEPTPAAASSRQIDFQAEFAAGRYKGGFIGFFLATPQGQGACSTPNCGTPTEAGCVGRLYYTEKEINGDGNYVHYLIYQTKLTDAGGKRRDDYYFGFEDLYRGGDNDFEDMLILVKGLVVPCTPSAEICDGKDNNCDGLIDNNPTDTGTPCYNGPGGTQNVGECKPGVLTCASTGPGDTTKTCVGEVQPSGELCDGKDNNCDGVVDNAPFAQPLPNACPPQSQPCSSTTQCVNGGPKCVVAVGPQPEVCNGIDDDCNGIIDDNLTDENVPCTPTGVEPTIGECKQGTSSCVGGALLCNGYVGPKPETCDGLDNDCNGQIDDGNVQGLSTQCSPPNTKVCTFGTEICLNGAKVCQGFVLPAPEKCDGADNDCNGIIDDNPLDTGSLCGSNVGACVPGKIECVPKTPGDLTTDELVCVGETGPGTEVCDGLDNDCDGFIDEDPDGAGPGKLQGVGDPCSTASGCVGTQQCKDGNLLCVGSGGSKEICNGIDDDCNGIIDDNPTDVGALCGSSVGVCVPGKLICAPKTPGDLTTDELTCDGGVVASTEICDGLDNDCDGLIDEDPDGAGPMLLPGVGVACGSAACGTSVTECKDGNILCKTSGGQGTPEVCNGIDDDCDGLIDDNPTDVGGPCGSSVGACKPGKLACVPKTPGDPTTDQIVCEGEVVGTDEICDGIDNDCDGFIDEDPDGDGPMQLPGIGVSCAVGEGDCGKGVTSCKNGAVVCEGNAVSQPEVCDGIDNDCNGKIDDNPVDTGIACGSVIPPCTPGVLKCEAGKLVCDGASTGSDEVCDGIDNNCNGLIDEDPDGAGPKKLAGVGDACAPEGAKLDDKGLPVGECKAGKKACVAGKLECIGAVGPLPEVCDGRDNDCNGDIDIPNPCPAETLCIEGRCAQKCVMNEFSNCPGGEICVSGYCRKPGSGAGGAGGAGAGGAGQGGKGGKGGMGAGATSGSVGGAGQGAGGDGAGASGLGGSGAGAMGTGSGAMNGAGARAGSGAVNPTPAPTSTVAGDSDGDGQPDNWGKATGSGGCGCTMAPAHDERATAGALAALAALLTRLRRPRRGGRGNEVSR